MKKSSLIVLLFTLLCIFALASCNAKNDTKPTVESSTNSHTTAGNSVHTHKFEEWIISKKPTCTEDGTNVRYCSCGEMQTQTTPAYGHEVVIDPAMAATCTDDGRTEGKHCSRCNETLAGQTIIQASGHQYDGGMIISKATCNKEGIKRYECTVPECNHSYTETYLLPKYSATELYNQAVKYVGEIITYDKNGNEYALGTGFVISADGKILTNYHVIEGAYSADITIDGTKYIVATVLAYDVDIDLAVLKINATGLTTAKICKQPVNVGTTVYAIGSSRGLTNTYSQGIITYADRVIDGISCIQHDASITNGNSGGPLINEYGEVIGINTWGISDSQNLNFAVFVDEIDNLVYGTPIALSELFEEKLTPYEVLLNWLIKNQNRQNSDIICYDYWQGSTLYSLCYDPEYDYMCILINDGSYHLLLDLSCDPSQYYYLWDWQLETPTDYYKVTGEINAYTFTSNTKLNNYNYTSGIYLKESDVVPMAQTCIRLAIEYLRNILLSNPGMGLSIVDFGFIAYS